jgi:integrase
LRQGEIAALAWDDWDEARNVLYIRRALKDKGNGKRPPDWPKGNKVRLQQLHPNAIGLLHEQRDRLKTADLWKPLGPIFPARNGEFRRTSAATIDPETFRRLVVAADLPNPAQWTPHSCRHTFMTLESVGNYLTTGDLRGAMARGGHWSAHNSASSRRSTRWPSSRLPSRSAAGRSRH